VAPELVVIIDRLVIEIAARSKKMRFRVILVLPVPARPVGPAGARRADRKTGALAGRATICW
jgi:hypothetical protein